MKLFKTRRQPEITHITADLQDYRFIGEEMEALGSRLDAARLALAQARTAWARWYWSETLDRLLTQWRTLPVLNDGQARMTLTPRWNVDYEFWENHQELGWDITDKVFDKIYRTNLDESWDRVRTERIMRCNCQ